MIAGTQAEYQAEYQSDAGSTKDTPYLALTGEIWVSFVNIFETFGRVLTAPHCIGCKVWVFFMKTYCVTAGEYRQVSNIRRTKSQHLKDSRSVLRLSLPNPLKPDVKSRIKI